MAKLSEAGEKAFDESLEVVAQCTENLQIRLDYCKELAELCDRQNKIYEDLCKVRDQRGVDLREYNDEAALAILEGARYLTQKQVNILLEHAQSWGMDDTMIRAVKAQLGKVMAIRFVKAVKGCGLLEAKVTVEKAC